MSRLTLRPLWGRDQSAIQRLGFSVRRWRLRTIRGRLLVGLSATLAALIASGMLSIFSLQRLYRYMGTAVSAASKISTLLFEGYDVTLRYVATAQSTILDGRPERVAQAESLSVAADSLRRALLRSDALDIDDRRALEQLGAMQGRIEVRFNVARAYRDVGNTAGGNTHTERGQ